ncbi:hypothetical protein JCM10908_004753 [Rhodotorula pacifica]|uniref:Zn(II)2Cys6 transcription factor n=1 Tax=Rhodotorula pacifica TaxID=1495444 RepID=UPI00317FFCFE
MYNGGGAGGSDAADRGAAGHTSGAMNNAIPALYHHPSAGASSSSASRPDSSRGPTANGHGAAPGAITTPTTQAINNLYASPATAAPGFASNAALPSGGNPGTGGGEYKGGVKRSASDMQAQSGSARGSDTPMGTVPAVAASGGGAGGGGNSSSRRSGKSKSAKDAEKEKKTRSKTACAGCKSVKQKCEGPPYVPCRRCELYKLECKFPPGTHTIPRPPEDMLSANTGDAVAQRLYEISTRLQSIESALRLKDSHDSPGIASSYSYDRHHRSPSPHTSDDGAATDEDASVGRAAAAEANPLHEINATIDQIQGVVRTPKYPFMQSNDYGAPDALRRGLLTAEECQQLFDFFFASLHPWVMMFSLDADRDPLAVRARSPLLFHTILLLSTAYSSPFPSQLHLTLVTFVNAIIAPQILNPQPHELTTDFLRAIDIINLFKPCQLTTRKAEGMDTTEALRASKVNGLASWMLQGILARTAERLDLKETVPKFARAHSASANGTPVPKELLRDLRLYFWLLCNDVHGNVQSGRRCNMEGGHALTVTRLFSSMHLQPYDVRLAASVEMFEVARPILRSYAYERTRRIPKHDLERYTQGMRSFDETWIPVLIRQLSSDPLAMTVISPFREFITLQFNSTCYTSWKSNRLYTNSSSDSDGGSGRPTSSGGPEARAKRLRTDGPRGLNDWEFEGLQRCVKAAEFLLFSLSEESRTPGAWRSVQWEEAERADGWRKLTLDDQIVGQSKWGMDAINCIAYIFPLVFLAKLVNDGILTTNLDLLRDPQPQPPWQYTQKLPRLLELGAAFLDAVGTCEEHPSHAQAQVVRTLLETGIKTQSSHTANSDVMATLSRDQSTISSPSGRVIQQLALPAYPGAVQQHYRQLAPQQMQMQQPQQQQQQQQLGAPTIGGPATASIAGFQGSANTDSLQQMQPQQEPQRRSSGFAPIPLYSSSGAVDPAASTYMPVMNDALGSVLNDFEPLFGNDTDGALWQWGFNPNAVNTLS